MDPREKVLNIDEQEGDITADNNMRQLNFRNQVSRKAEMLRQKSMAEEGEELTGVDDGVPDDDPSAGVSDAFLVNDDTLQKSMEKMPVAQAPVQKHKLKVMGEEIEMTTEELIAHAQKVKAADQYLAEAKREAEALKSSARQETYQSPPVEQVQQPSQVDAGVPDEDLVAVARNLQVGSEEDAVNALKSLLRRASPSINTDEIAAKTVNKIRFDEDIAWFKKEFPDIVGDQNLLTIAMNKDAQLINGGDTRRYRDRFLEIGTEIREWLGKSPANEEKKERKKETLRTIPQASVRAVDTAEDEPDDSPTAVIYQMAKARGQQRA